MTNGLKYVSEVAPSGYGRAGRSYMRALRMAGADLTWTPMVAGTRWNMYQEPFEGETLDDELGELCNRPIDYGTVMVHLISPYFPLWRAAEPDKKLIGITVWETDRIPVESLDEIRHLDGLIVPCRWNGKVYRDAGVTCPIHIAPHAHFDDGTAPGNLELPGIAPDDFVFYTIGEWNERKGMHLTVESFCRAFTRHDPVALVVKTKPVNERRRKPGHWWWHVVRRIETARRDIARIVGAHRNPPKVVALTRELPAAGMRALHARGDCYVSLTRSEGWGLGAYEAAFAGKPVIMTAHGGQLDFLPASLSYHVRFKLIAACPTGQIESGLTGHRWANPDLDHGAHLMREVFADREAARECGRRLREHVTAAFDPLQIARDILDFADGLTPRSRRVAKV